MMGILAAAEIKFRVFSTFCRNKFARLVPICVGFLRPALQLALFAIFLVFFGLPLVLKYQEEEVDISRTLLKGQMYALTDVSNWSPRGHPVDNYVVT